MLTSILLGIAVLRLAAKPLDALTLGADAARSMGVDMRALLWLLIIGVGLTVGASVAVAGIIGFVGLIVPHLRLGIALSLIGAPFFLWLLLRMRRGRL